MEDTKTKNTTQEEVATDYTMKESFTMTYSTVMKFTKKIGSSHDSRGDLSRLEYGHLNSAMPLHLLLDGSYTLASGDAPSHPFDECTMKPQRVVVRPQWPLMCMYFW